MGDISYASSLDGGVILSRSLHMPELIKLYTLICAVLCISDIHLIILYKMKEERKDRDKDALDWALLISCCSIANRHRLSGLKHDLFIMSHFCRSEVQARRDWLLCFRSYKAEMKLSLSLGVFSFRVPKWMWWPCHRCCVGLRCLFPCRI